MKTSFDQYSDGELLEMYKKSADGRVLGRLLGRYSLLVFGVCIKYLKDSEEAKDASQQVFEKVIGEIDKYAIPYFKSWLYSVTKNHCLMYLRSAETRFRMAEKNIESVDLVSHDDELIYLNELIHESNMQKLRNALSNLNPDQAACIDMFYLKKLSYKEIEEKTGMNFQQVKSHLQNGKRNLKMQLEKQKFNNEG